MIKVGSKPFIRSVPKELNLDQSAVLEAVQVLGYVSISMLMVNLKWPKARAQTALEDLLGEGMLWVDKQCPEWEYWSPGFMVDTGEAAAGEHLSAHHALLLQKGYLPGQALLCNP